MTLADQLVGNLTDNILPFWLGKMKDSHGGFYGRIDGHDTLHPESERGTILNARILWTLSAAALATGRNEYREEADRQFRYFADHFIDREFGGCFWSVNPDGTPADTRKQFYAIAFAIYGLTEYVRLTGNGEALALAIDLFHVIETHSRDRVKGGYVEAALRDWSPILDMRLSEKDLNSSKTMNTHLHILEAYTNLLRVWRSEECLEATATLLRLFNSTIVDPLTGHLCLFFYDDFNRVDHAVSYGHDIEASWLMLECAQVIGDPALLSQTEEVTRRVALAALEGLQPDGSMIYELHDDGTIDAERHWWVQAETLVGLVYLARFHHMPEMLEKAMLTWQYIDSNIVDHVNGEWHWSILPDGSVNVADDKAGFWKCPYHNSRMCIEASRQLREGF